MNTKASFIVLLLLLLHQLLLDKPLYQGVYYYSFSTNWFIGICHFKSAKLCRSSYDMHEHHHLAPTEQLIRLIAWHHGPLEGNRGIPWRRRGEVLSRMTRGITPSYPFNFIKSYCGCHYKNTTGSNEQFESMPRLPVLCINILFGIFQQSTFSGWAKDPEEEEG